jgi:methylisocitrate lyase
MSLRARLNDDPRIVVAIGAHDPLTALIAERSGMEAVYQGGYAVSAHAHALPDIGLIGLEDVSQVLRRITAVTSIPVIVDADTGYGSEAGVRRTIRELESAGAAAIQLEDQVFPKRCGHMAGKRVVPAAEMVSKLKAAVGARGDGELLIIARTDALAVHGLDDAIERASRYAEAGADVVFVEAPRSNDELAEIADRVSAPLMANMTEKARTPPLPAGELEAMGYRIVIFPSTQTWLFAYAYAELCREVLATGTTNGLSERFTSFDDINELLGLARWDADPATEPEKASQ